MKSRACVVTILGFWILAAGAGVFPEAGPTKKAVSATVPFALDHNRMVVEAEFQRPDGGWEKARLWVDTGNPDFFINEGFARRLGIGVDAGKPKQEISAPAEVRIGGMPVDFGGVSSSVDRRNLWLFHAIHNDGNLPSTVLKRYHVVFDYPARRMTLAEPGVLKPIGVRSPAGIHPVTGIVQMEALIDGEKYSFALDNGASFSYVSDTIVEKFKRRHPEWPGSRGAVGCANIWGWWPGEESWPLLRVPEIRWGGQIIPATAIAGMPAFFNGGKDVGAWYSQKTAAPVDGFFGPNVFKAFRVEIDYAENAVYLLKGTSVDIHDLDIVGLTLRPLNDERYQVIGVVEKDGKPMIAGIEPDDVLIQVGDLKTTGATMGTVVDALRGKPGDRRILKLERNGKSFIVETVVERIL
jgi:hypothetical protein